MLPRPCACHGAVQRNLPTHLESLWIADDILRHEWQRFVLGSKIHRRYGSFVPGPLEARRRMGKRRMAHLSADCPPPLPSISSLWGSFWEVDRSQWQWEAPRSREPEPESFAPARSRVQDKVRKSVSKSKVTTKAFSHQDVLTFRSKIKSCDPDKLPAICNDFNQHFKHSLTHGTAPETAIIHALKGIPRDLRRASPSAAEHQCLDLYNAMWDGFMACRILRKDYLEVAITKSFMTALGNLSMTMEVQKLVISVIGTLSAEQLDASTQAIGTMVDRLVDSWLPTITESSHSNIGVKRALHSFPQELAKVLRCLPEKTLFSVFHRGSKRISLFHEAATGVPIDVRYTWLFLASQLPGVSKEMFLWSWKTMEACGVPLQENIMSTIILQYWIEQDRLLGVDMEYLNGGHRKMVSRGEGFGPLLHLLEDDEDLIWNLRKQLINMLLAVGQHQTLYNIFSHMKEHKKPLSMPLLGRILEATVTSEGAFALRLYRKCIDMRGEDKQRFIPELCPNFVLSLVNNPDITWPHIWHIIRIPFRGDVSRLPKSRVGSPPITPKKIELVTKLAVAFARSKTRPPRVILRNVSQCLLYLRRHNATLNPDVSRALTQAAINLKMKFNKAVPQERAEWAVRIIQSVEGPDVAEAVHTIVNIWNERIYEKQRRAINVLGVGPID
ncbi:uncharacterized protein PAC_00464 [Phialocephala subalpina]|uniref:Uncharacterized protein n=1 Tax=Phialocephala subalpina TaxID=576137 RepID=A0A1L7WCS2_9HELO|nr:uncharacterized protein PAC_00464 [Phialocephala subalpina]